MTRAELEAMGLQKDQIDKIMQLNGEAVNAEKAKAAKLEEEKGKLEEEKKQLGDRIAEAEKTIEGFSDYEETKAAVEKYKQEAEQAKADAAQKLQQMELTGKIKDFTGNKKFVNEITRKAINSQLAEELNKAENKGKSMEDLFTALIGENKDILVDENKPQPPKVGGMGNGGADPDDDAKARAVMGLPPKK